METKFKFTPGPWKLNEHFTLISETTKNEIVFGCGLTMCGRVTKDREIGANAKLIAAAPELLKALCDIIESIDNEFGAFKGIDRESLYIIYAKKAIKKATE